MGFEWLWRFAGRAAGPRDGQGLSLEAIAPDAALMALPGAPSPAGTLQGPAPDVSAVQGARGEAMRRQREAGLRVLSAKLLGAHLANRHQISYPLALDFRTLSEEDRDLLLDAATLASVSGGEGEAVLEGAAARLARQGADEAMLERLRLRSADPPALNAIVARARRLDRAAHVYAASLLAAGSRSAPGRLYLSFLAARLGLSGEVVGSINRRYRD